MTDTNDIGSVTSADPDENTPVLIRNGHTVTIDGNNREAGNLQIQAHGVLDCISYTGLNFGVVTNPEYGSGKIRISSNTFPSGDFTEFRGTSGGTVEFYTPAGSGFTIPTISASGEALTCYRNLILTPAAGQTITMPNTNLTIYGNMTAQGDGTTRLNTVTARTLDIGGDLAVTSGTLQFRNGQSQTITVDGDVSITSGATFNVQNFGTTTNSLTIFGDLINDGTLNFNNSNSCDITFAGSTSASLTGTGNTTLRNLTINKGSSQATTLTVDVSGATFSTPTNNWLTLTNGTFRFMRTGNLNVTTTGTFTIPTTAGFYVNHASAVVYLGNANSNTNDVYLNGKLTLIDGTIYVGPSAAPNNNNDIEYSASGNSEIEIQGGTLVVNGQIRRSTSGTGGVLVYNQSGGDVIINGRNQSAVRAKLEIENAGSEFTMSAGTLTLVRGGGTTFGDLYLRPASGSVTGGTIYLQPVNNIAAGEETFLIDANMPLNNLTITGFDADDAARASLSVNPLVLNGNLTLSNANSYLTSNNINITIGGDMTNNGTYTPGTNTTTFDGTAQNLNGTTATQFYDLYVDPSTSLTLENDITVNNTLTLNSGTFYTDTYDVNAKGNVVNNAIHSGNTSAGGLLLNGTSQQLLSGTGTYGRMELDNTAGARFLNNISLEQDFLLTNGVLDINQYLLSLGTNSDIVGSGFSSSKMIKPDGVLSNIGIRKYFSAGATTFTYPIGVTGKYTPAVLTITANGSAGYIRVNVINDHHPTVTDPNNVLQYYWEVESSGISGFEGNLVLNYTGGDVLGTESDYVAARLVVPPGTDWSKASTGPTTDNVDETLNTILFEYPAGTSNLGGEYTAGTDAAIPDQVPTYTSNSDGDWDDVNIWTPVAPAGGPNGFIVIIRAEDSVYTNGNKRFAYRTTINGVLNLNSTYGHNLGDVDGTGKLYLETATLPAGRFTSFFNCSGGTLEYGGSSDFTIVADRIDTVKNLYFTGTGDRILPDKDLVICNLLKIDGPTLDNSTYNRKLTLLGAVQRLNTGVFVSGTGANATVSFKGSAAQEIGGSDGNFTGGNALNNMEIDNSSGLTLNGPLELKRNLLLTDGIITTTPANLLSMLNWNTSVVPTGGSLSSFVNGPMSKRIFAGDDFEFPTGKSTRYGKIVLLDISTEDDWEAEYFNTGYSSTAVTSPLTAVSSNEYWHVTGPASEQAYVKLRWDYQSDITPLTTQNGVIDIRVAEYNTTTWVAQSTSASGDDYDGTAETTVAMDLDEHDYTLGSVSTLKPRASFTDTTDACVGDDLFVAFTNTAASYTFNYNIDGGSDIPVTTSDNPYTLATASAGRYKLTSYTGGIVDTNSVLVNPAPTASLTSDDADNTICYGTTVIFTAGGADSYEFYLNSVSVQNGASNTYTTSTLDDGDAVFVVVTNSYGCSATSASISMTVHALPVITIAGNDTTCGGSTETYITEAGMSNYSWTVSIGGSVVAGGGVGDNSVTVEWGAVVPPPNPSPQSVAVNYTDSNGCSAAADEILEIDVFKTPVTGPQYHINNNWEP